MRFGLVKALCGVWLMAGVALADSAASTSLKSYAVNNSYSVNNATREAYSQPFEGLSNEELAQFFRGRSLFRQSWVIAPAQDSTVGLGPLYNRIACASCHPKNGRGRAPDDVNERMQSMLVRLSVPGTNAHGGPKPHPHYGDQFNEFGVPGVPGEGRVHVRWEYQTIAFADGTEVRLRSPQLVFTDLHYGALMPVQTSARIGPSVFGLGLLDAVSETELVQLAQQPKPEGVKGRVNQVWDITSQQVHVGRFGAKANVANLRAQIVGAMLGDMGITSAILPHENCQPNQYECSQVPTIGVPELTNTQLIDLEFYVNNIAVPAPRNVNSPQVQAGAKIFNDIGCSLCHRTELQTAKNHSIQRFANVKIQPYTDLLLHDMGDGLADGRPDFQATGREWRTPPLWGIGLTGLINEYQSYLHDGRAQTFAEAILWHGGEAEKVREHYQNLSGTEREALNQFLLSL